MAGLACSLPAGLRLAAALRTPVECRFQKCKRLLPGIPAASLWQPSICNQDGRVLRGLDAHRLPLPSGWPARRSGRWGHRWCLRKGRAAPPYIGNYRHGTAALQPGCPELMEIMHGVGMPHALRSAERVAAWAMVAAAASKPAA